MFLSYFILAFLIQCNMRISVVIPAYNEEQYIRRCLESLMQQTRKPYEIIVVNNNSTDKTTSIVKEFPKVKLIHEQQQGITATRNTGFTAAKGDIIARTDADTIVPKTWIEHIHTLFIKNNIDAVSGPAVYYDLPIKSDIFLSLFFGISKVMFGHPILLGPNVSIKTDMWHRIQDKTCADDARVHEDLDMSIHIHRAGGIIMNDSSLIVKCSARRILTKPQSFFIEYTMRYFKMLLSHAFT